MQEQQQETTQTASPDRTERRLVTEPRGTDRVAAGAPPSNTAPVNSLKGGSVKIIRTGIDSLYLSYPGTLAAETSIRLDKLKELAQSVNPAQVALAQYKAGDHLFEVRDRGSHLFAYVLADNWYRINIASSKAMALPLALAQIASELLTLQGARLAESVLRGVVDTLGLVEGDPSVSRADVCVDFVTDYPLHLIRDEDWITRAKTINRYTVHRQFSGFSIGGGGALSARLYNKSLEIESSGKTFFHEVWKRYGWQPGETVWRLEFQFRRAVLKELGVLTFPELLDTLGGLWGYAMRAWLRLADPTSTVSKRSELPTHPLWEALTSLDWLDAEPCVRQPVETGRPPSDERLFVHGLSAISAYMAREGLFDPDEAYRDFWVRARAYHNARAEMTGLQFADYLREKARIKARQYNSVNNRDTLIGPDPVTEAVARAYKKRRDE
jgi:hypothetical protein